MRLEHSFTVPVPVDQAWDVLLDVERIAPCMPGAALTDVRRRDVHRHGEGQAGPGQPHLQGQGPVRRARRAARRVVIEASGRDAAAAGTAAATVTAVLHARRRSTLVEVVTDLTVTGKPAQFGRGMIADVSGKLLGPVRRLPRRPARRARPGAHRRVRTTVRYRVRAGGRYRVRPGGRRRARTGARRRPAGCGFAGVVGRWRPCAARTGSTG